MAIRSVPQVGRGLTGCLRRVTGVPRRQRVKAEKFARHFAEKSGRNEVRVVLRSPHIFVSRLRCQSCAGRCTGDPVDAGVCAADARSRPVSIPMGAPPEYAEAVRDAARRKARMCEGRVWRGLLCRHGIASRSHGCRVATLASGSWLSWFCKLGAAMSFGGTRHSLNAFVAVKNTTRHYVRDGVACVAVRHHRGRCDDVSHRGIQHRGQHFRAA